MSRQPDHPSSSPGLTRRGFLSRCRCCIGAPLLATAVPGCATAQPGAAAPIAAASVPLDLIRQRAAALVDPAVQFLSATLRYESVEDFGYQLKPATADLLAFVLQEGARLGFSPRMTGDGLVGVLEMGSGSESVGVVIHVDVVPPTDLAHWTHPPFSGAVADGHVWGRGAQDDKGALAAALYAAKLLADAGLPFRRQLRIVLGTKEEKDFEDMERWLAAERQPDFGIVPDGVYFIIGEKGIADTQLRFRGLAAATPGRDTITGWSGGAVINSVPDFSWMMLASSDVAAARRDLEAAVATATAALAAGQSPHYFGTGPAWAAKLSVLDRAGFVAQYGVKDAPAGDLVLVSQGEASHGSAPWAGRNAVIEVALAASLLPRLSENAYLRAARFVVGKLGVDMYGAGLAGPDGKGIPFNPPPGLPAPPPGLTALQYFGTSTNLGLVTQDARADELVLWIDFRTGLGNTNPELLAHVQAAAAMAGGSADYVPGYGSHFDPIHHPGDDPLRKLALQSYREVYPDRPSELPYTFFSPGTTYLKVLKNFVNFGPVDLYPDPTIDRFHVDDERIAIASLQENIVLFAQVLQNMLQADASELPLRR